MAAGDDRYVVQSLDRGLELLQILARANGVVLLDDLAGLAGIPSSTVFRLLATLERRGLVRRTDSPAGYRVGVGCVELGGAYLASLDLVQEARPLMKDLLASFQQTVHLGVLGVSRAGVSRSVLATSAPAVAAGEVAPRRRRAGATDVGDAASAARFTRRSEVVVTARR